MEDVVLESGHDDHLLLPLVSARPLHQKVRTLSLITTTTYPTQVYP